MKLLQILLATSFVVSSAAAVAKPDELDLIGLRMGQSEAADVERIGKPVYPSIPSSNFWYLTIGGHEMPCSVTYIDGKLSQVLCMTGEGSGGKRRTTASNEQVHTDLKSGYSQKFGKPEVDDFEEVRTRMGVKYTKNSVSWMDAKGNTLYITNLSSMVSSGGLHFTSAEKIKLDKEEKAKKDAAKQF
jgi:hypothetical protein